MKAIILLTVMAISTLSIGSKEHRRSKDTYEVPKEIIEQVTKMTKRKV